MADYLQTVHWNTESNHNKFLSYMDIIFCYSFFLYPGFFILPICLIQIYADNIHIEHCGHQRNRSLTEEIYISSNGKQCENLFSQVMTLWIHCTVREGVKSISGLCTACTYFSNNSYAG